MSQTIENLPEDPAELRDFARSLQHEIQRLQWVVAKLQRHQFGRRAETVSADQLYLALNGQAVEVPAPVIHQSDKNLAGRKPSRKALPAHLPREESRHVPAGAADPCQDCGGLLHVVGEDVSEMLEYIPARFKVIRHIRPKWACKCCNRILQATAPERPIPQGLAGPDLLAHVMVSKYCDHLPLYRQSTMYARDGVDLARSTLADWVGKTSALLSPLVAAIQRHALGGDTVHADDTPIPVLEPGKGRTKTGRLWTYVRDERPRASEVPPAVWFAYTPDRRGEHPQAHLKSFRGILQADGYAGFNAIYQRGGCVEAACMAHVRRKFYEIHESRSSPQATQALEYIGQLYRVEAAIRDRPPDERRQYRQAHAIPVLGAFRQWLDNTLMRVSAKSDMAVAIRYALARWTALTRYAGDGRIEIDNNAAERALRAIALGRKNYLFAGSDSGGESAAALYTLIGTAKLNQLDPMAYLRQVIATIGQHPINQIDALLPWNIQLPDNTSTHLAEVA